MIVPNCNASSQEIEHSEASLGHIIAKPCLEGKQRKIWKNTKNTKEKKWKEWNKYAWYLVCGVLRCPNWGSPEVLVGVHLWPHGGSRITEYAWGPMVDPAWDCVAISWVAFLTLSRNVGSSIQWEGQVEITAKPELTAPPLRMHTDNMAVFNYITWTKKVSPLFLRLIFPGLPCLHDKHLFHYRTLS